MADSTSELQPTEGVHLPFDIASVIDGEHVGAGRLGSGGVEIDGGHSTVGSSNHHMAAVAGDSAGRQGDHSGDEGRGDHGIHGVPSRAENPSGCLARRVVGSGHHPSLRNGNALWGDETMIPSARNDETKRPSNDGVWSLHKESIAERYSSVRAPRSASGTPSARSSGSR